MFHETVTFHPRINEKSKKIGRKSSLYELCYPPSKRRNDEQVYMMSIARPQSALIARHNNGSKCTKKSTSTQYTDYPIYNTDDIKFSDTLKFANEIKVNAKKNNSKRFETVDQLILHQQEKCEKLLQARQKLDKEMMQECTFHPSINSETSLSNMSKKVVIAGLERFNELRELAKKQKMELQERERKAFSVDKFSLKSRVRNVKGALVTVPDPFSFVDITTSQNDTDTKQFMTHSKNITCTKNVNCNDSFAKDNNTQRDLVWKILKQECSSDIDQLKYGSYQPIQTIANEQSKNYFKGLEEAIDLVAPCLETNS